MLTRIKNIILINQSVVDYVLLLLIQGMNFLIPMIIMPYLMKVLGAGSFGIIGFSQAVIGYFILVIDFGFNFSATKNIAINIDNRNQLNKIFTSTLITKLLLLCASLLVLTILILSGVFSDYNLGLICSIPSIIGSTLTVVWWYQGIGKIKKLSLITVLSRILILPLIFVFVKDSSDYLVAIFIQSSVFFVTGILSIYPIFKNKAVTLIKIKWSDVYNQLKDSFPLFLSSASITIYTSLFVLILGMMASTETVGKYTAAEKIMRSLVVVLYVPLNQLFYPKISRVAANNKEEALYLLKRILLVGLILMLTVFFVLFFCADYIYVYLGDDYKGITGLIRIFSITPFFILLGGILGQLGLLAMGDNSSKMAFKNTYYVAAAFSLPSLVVLAYFFAEYGIALTVLFTEVFISLLMLAKFYKYCNKNNLKLFKLKR